MTNKIKIPKNEGLSNQFRDIIFSIETFLPEIISEDGEWTLEEYKVWHQSVVKQIQALAEWKKKVDDYVVESNT
jgi:hypothetical protein